MIPTPDPCSWENTQLSTVFAHIESEGAQKEIGQVRINVNADSTCPPFLSITS